MRLALSLAVAALVAALPTFAGARELSKTNPNDAILLERKVHCSTKDNKPIFYWWHGRMFSRVEGEQDRLLFKVEGMNVRQCVTVKDPERGTGYKLVSREILLYLDPQTNEVVRTWKNPWTGETVDVIHVANDPVNSRGTFPKKKDGSPLTFEAESKGSISWTSMTVPLFYTNPLTGDYQDYVGGKYQATEFFNFFMPTGQLFDSGNDTVKDVSVSWERLSNWLPWMKMGSRQGLVYFHTAGRKVGGYDDLPEVMRKEIETNYPAWKGPPPSDDARPNETTWTVTKKFIDSKRAQTPAAPKP